MVDVPVKFVSVEIKEDQIEQGALDILKEIREDWNPGDIQFRLLTDGITNKLVKCYLTDNSEDVVLVRIYGQKTDMLIDRKAETRNIILLHNANLAPQLFATFKNGLAYEFVPGVTLIPKTVIEPIIYNLVAAKMAQLHLVRPTEYINRKPMIWNKILQFYNLIPDVFTDSCKHKRFEELTYMNPKSKFLTEINEMKENLSELNSPIVFAHNDLLLGNVIYDKDKSCVTFIDYEYADMNYQAFDIANHFAEFQGIDVNAALESTFPSKQLQLEWLHSYLQVYNKTNTITNEELEHLRTQVNNFVLASHVLWGLWALVQAEYSTIDFDYIEYGKLRLGQYFSWKQQLNSEENNFN